MSWLNEKDERGIDYDLRACLENNPQPFGVSDIDKVLAVYEGENDERDWRWIIRLKGNLLVYLRGGCDYTGGDCQSSAHSTPVDTLEEALTLAANGLGSKEELMAVVATLKAQFKSGKLLTWREIMDQEFGVDSNNQERPW